MDENNFGVLAGWYPDPLGLPQLRWWDGQGWAEHTSEARAPIVEQFVTMVAGHDSSGEQLPSRRSELARERAEDDEASEEHPVDDFGYAVEDHGDQNDSNSDDTDFEFDFNFDFVDEPVTAEAEYSAQGLLEMTLKEFEPPQAEDLSGSEAREWESGLASSSPELITATEPGSEEQESHRSLRSYTAAAWLISGLPLFQLISLLIIVPLVALGQNWPVVIMAWVAPYLVGLGLAAHDKLMLTSWGHRNPASPRWAFLTALGYLIVRARRVRRETGHTSPLLLILGLSFAALFIGCAVVPGLVISVAPSAFVSEIESAVVADARAGDVDITVDCPSVPPILMGESFTCRGLREDGQKADIVVSLQRQNGWITWQIDDWDRLLSGSD
ncbi:MAG: DUF2510 domain-containing protein [Rhodoglobus sp.]